MNEKSKRARASRNKGQRREREVCRLLIDAGVHAERVPLSGAAGGAYSGDIDAWIDGMEEAAWVGEVKSRKDGRGFQTVLEWLGLNDFLIIWKDREEPRVVLPWSRFKELIKR